MGSFAFTAYAFFGVCMAISGPINRVEKNFEARIASHRAGLACNPIFADCLLLGKPSSKSLLHGFEIVGFGLVALTFAGIFSLTFTFALPAGFWALAAFSRWEGH